MILIDHPRWPAHGHRFAHLVSDTSFDELHAFAAQFNFERPLKFHRDHYDIPEHAWNEVVAAGATVVGVKELVTRARAAGLRTSP